MTPLALAILHGHLGIAIPLVHAGASPLPADNNGESLMCFAVTSGHPSIIRWLARLPTGPKFINAHDPSGNTALHYAVCRENLELARALLECGADPDIQALPVDPPTNKEAGGDDDTTPTPALGVGTALAFTINPSTQHTPANRLAMVSLLLQHRAKHVMYESLGVYPLHEAASHEGMGDIVAALLDHFPDMDINVGTVVPNDPLMSGITPLMYACGMGELDVVRLLLARGADAAKVCGVGEGPVHWAAVTERGEAEVRELLGLLVEAGVDVNAQHQYGGTALHGPAYRGLMANVKVLLEMGADRGFVTSNWHDGKLLGIGGTPEEMARIGGHWEVAEFIKGWVGGEDGKGEGGKGEDGKGEGGKGEDGKDEGGKGQ